jgi:hypothetical protein
LGTTWTPARVLDGFGRLQDASDRAGVAGEGLATPILSAELPPGVYVGATGSLALNVVTAQTQLQSSVWPARVSVDRGGVVAEQDLKGWVLTVGLLALMLDILAALMVSGRLRAGLGMATLVLGMMAQPTPSQADDRLALAATDAVVLAHIIIGDPRIDEVAEAGLLGLSQTLFARSSVEPSAPIGIDLEADELSFFPFLYWPITEDVPIPSDAAYDRLNRYLRGGGMIMFDTRDAELSALGRTTPAARRLQAIAHSLDIPMLEPIPADHVLTRTFYLLQDFPGRYSGGDVWVEAAAEDAQQSEGMPFRNLNDGVTPVIIGGNDWAAAWAVNANGAPLLPVGRGRTGERQRELALRFGVNLIMHVLTGNYKSDQVHVPALLERLGQ